MAGTEETYHMTKEDIRKPESKASKTHGGNVPAESDAAGLQSIVDKGDRNKKEIIEERKANLPLPDAPPVPSDFNSADQRTVNIGSGEQPTGNFSKGDDALREPATGPSEARVDSNALKTNAHGVRNVGREGEEGLGGLPNDAVTRDKKDHAGLADTTNP